MYHPDAAELRAGAEELVRHGLRLLDDGLAVGTAGNLSLRLGDTVLITPSGLGYRDLTPADICPVSLAATTDTDPTADAPANTDSGPTGPTDASSELPLHLAVYGATDAVAVVHTHSPEVVALSAVRDDLPAIHYAITSLGGPVQVASYERFGSHRLAQAALSALAGRSAVILRNHGAVTYGATLPQAYERALLLEWLARVYRMACSLGDPHILSAEELDEVAAEMRRRRYGEPR
ncbi:MAG TPA: class II aldolase/adducin family protein [Streptosporangiaceae bacterium]|jgi:L-fuculose-phosphate aldolase|nr:class II aldolase/adducin family protein [Streptosporangiaceae bacterium]